MRKDMFDAYMKAHVQPVPAAQDYEQKLRRTLEGLPARSTEGRKSGAQPVRRMALAVALALALVLVVTPSSDVMLTTQYLKAYPSEDEQQLIVEGIYVEPEITKKADADDDGGIHTDDYDEVILFLNMDPRFPEALDGAWKRGHIGCSYLKHGLSACIWYTCAERPEEELIYTIQSEPDVEQTQEFYDGLAEEGWKTRTQIGDVTAYYESFEKIEGDPRVMLYALWWMDEECLFSVQGLSSIEELERIAAEAIAAYRALPQEIRDRWKPTGERDYGVETCTLETYEQVQAFIGEDIPIPAQSYGAWTTNHYSCTRWTDDSHERDLHVLYKDPARPQDGMNISVYAYEDFENVYHSFEQSYQGRVIRHKDLQIYVTHNIDRLVCICMKDRVLYYVGGNIELDTAKSVLDQLVP